MDVAFGAAFDHVAPIASESGDQSPHSKWAGADRIGSAPAGNAPESSRPNHLQLEIGRLFGLSLG
jgi:hypothetical protein